MLKHILTITIASLFILAGSLFASLNYEGNVEGLKDRSYTIEFTIYRTQKDQTPVWQETHKGVEIKDGRFRVRLGEINPIPEGDGNFYLEAKIDGKVVVQRESISTTRLAWVEGIHPVGDITAAWAGEGLEGGGDEGEVELGIADGGVTSAKIEDGTIQQADLAFPLPDGHSLDAADGDPVDALYVDNDGNVGIGTTSPTTALHIHSSWATGQYITSSHSSGVGGVACVLFANDFTGPGTGNFASIGEMDGELRLSGRGGILLTDLIITDGGNVGIGTTSPTSKLHVVGDIHCTGKLTSDGGNDPPYVLYDKETRESIRERVAKEVPKDKLDGAVLFWNGEDLRFEVYLPERGEFRDLQGNLLAKVAELSTRQ